MDAQQFLTEFGHIANAPGGVERLRELIYQFAVTGRLAPQQAEEGDASLVLERVAAVRQQLIREKRFKRTAKLESETLVAHAVALPESWRWSRLLDLGEINPRNDVEEDHAATFVPMAAVSEKHGQLLGGEVTRWGAISKGYTHFANGDVLIAKITPCFENGKAARVTGLQYGIGAGSTEFHVFRPISEDVSPDYVYLFLRSPLFRVRGQTSMTGTAGQKRLPTDYFALCAMPLPPKGEQARIVTKVDELMALCDRLEKQQQDRRQLQNALRQSTLRALSSAESPHELQESWQRLQAHFGRLFSQPEDVRDFKALVLDLAVSGRLLPATNGSTPASALIESIARARLAWAEESEEQENKEAVAMLKKLRTQQITVPTAPLPSHWCWASLLQVSQAVVDCHNKTAPYVDKGIHLVRTTDIRDGRMDLTKTRKISEETYAYWARRMPPKAGDIFFTREAPMGEAAIVPEGERVCLGQRTMLIRLFPELFSSRYLLYVIQSPSFQARMIEAAIGMTVKHLRVGGVEDLMVPVPPREEQSRIVEIVDRLFELCDHHADRIGNGLRVAANLAITTVAALMGISVDAEEESPLKAPQTELIAPLRLGTLPDVKDLAPLATLLARNQGEMSARDLWQRFGGEIDAFYAQLKTEVAHGWITEPPVAEVRAKPVETAEA
jgi:type I restriction enzyme S subunit